MRAYSSFIRSWLLHIAWTNKERCCKSTCYSSWNNFFPQNQFLLALNMLSTLIYASKVTKHACLTFFSRHSGEMTVLQGIRVIPVTSLLWLVIMFLTVAFFVIPFALLKLKKNYLKFCLVSIDICFPLLSWDFRHYRELFFSYIYK